VENDLEKNAKKEQRTAGGERGRRWRSREQARGKGGATGAAVWS
jgi:hypothetical protein